ncbi:MAG: hypothetical protein H6734_24185 [Alphaproteobacteria bacterium]|nr:hypothetical protein [Alphaproteobacteria bacterium]
MSAPGAIFTTRFSVKRVSFCPATLACEGCGDRRPRQWSTGRVALDLHLDGPRALDIAVGVYHCPTCQRWFRAQPPFLRRNAIYTNRVVRTAVASVISDGMAFSKVPCRMARDFGLRPSEASVRGWVRAWTEGIDLSEEYEPWVVETFSGVLCLDEVYQGRLALLLAVEPGTPVGDRLVGYQLVSSSVDGQGVERFLARLSELGIQPEQVVTDGSSLYPAALGRVWPEAAHQLCLFHETRLFVKGAEKLIQEVMSAIPRVPRPSRRKGGRLPQRHEPENPGPLDRAVRIALVRQLRADGLSIKAIVQATGHSRNAVRAWLRGTVQMPTELPELSPQEVAAALSAGEEPVVPSSPPEPWTSWAEVGDVKKTLEGMRHTLLRRRADLTPPQLQQWERLFDSPMGETLKAAHEFMQPWYGIWRDKEGHRRDPGEAWRRYEALRVQPDASRYLPLRRLQDKMGEDHFASLSPFLRHAHWRATSNACERTGRWFRHTQHRHFHLRTERSIRGVIEATALDRMSPLGRELITQAARSRRGRRPKRQRAPEQVEVLAA